MNELSDRDRRVLQLVARRASIREMASDLNVGLGTIQFSLDRLESGGFIQSPPTRQARMRRLTQKGIHVLQRAEHPDELEQFVISVRLRALDDRTFQYRTAGQCRRLVVQIEKALKNPENRKKVLQAITGLPIRSQNELTYWYHHVLIDETREAKDAELLRAIEDLTEAVVDCEPADLFPWYRPVPCVSDLREADISIR
jgi:DNA-binding transcriptional regulator YhcF (GntR family)